MLTLSVDTSEGRRRFGVLADSWKDLTPVLREFDRYKRGKIDELFASGGNGQWPERSERSEQRGWAQAIDRATAAPTKLRRKLLREFSRAKKRLHAAEERSVGFADAADSKTMKSRRNAVARRYFVLKEFERQVGGGTLDESKLDVSDRRLMKSVRGLQDRMGRQQGREGKLLGKLPQTIKSDIRNGLLIIDSRWDSPAPLALQDGATVNHGGELEPRPYLYWEPSDVEYLAVLLRERSMLAWAS